MNTIQLQNQEVTDIRRIPGEAFIRRYLKQQRGASEAADFMERVQQVYDELYARRPTFTNRHLRFHVEDNILVGLAIYRVFLSEGKSQADAFAETRGFLAASAEIGQSMRIIRLAKRFLPSSWFYPLIRRSVRYQMRVMFPAENWGTRWLEDSPRRLAFDTTRCLYLETLNAYGAPELTPAFCNVDDVLGAVMFPEVIFERSGTLARGSDRCDFCYRNGKAS